MTSSAAAGNRARWQPRPWPRLILSSRNPAACPARGCSQDRPDFRRAFPKIRRTARGTVSDSGSRMGVAVCCEARSEAVTVPGQTSLTCRYVLQQRLSRIARSVRIEGVRGSNPLSSTEKLQVGGSPAAPILRRGWELSPYWEESGRSCLPGPGGDRIPDKLRRLPDGQVDAGEQADRGPAVPGPPADDLPGSRPATCLLSW